ncbi:MULTISPECIES: hypothetical protein [Cupriavidus]|uniref:Uncharacterized protein n=1 Tax=Cupriavidus campinensis TaxID=151783 RepID=A0AAE9I457_9BURK|nr:MULTISPECIES: hypothetical protein [Cupriavidus]MCA3183458.1 hypothetical protein [Cupriavidus sp.]MCA3192110.1 hypothetical protein [Cupriavidus sp.]MCA3197855.1 hypothetical protein [Cupriavidus sp.]MCA3202908.1 hypothetical protein [Cupriavidus sp.]MCA3206458.1 hypothetical protein [Cupriavidus sp.]
MPDPQLIMPERDALGNLTGSRYVPGRFVNIRKRRFSTVAITNSLTGTQRHVSPGVSLTALDQLLKLNPYLVEARGNYAVVNPFAKLGRALPPLVDCMLTVELLANRGQPHLHAVFVNETRMTRVQTQLLSRGVTVELVADRSVSALALKNAARCYQTLLGLDIRALRAAAQAFAGLLLENYASWQEEELTLDQCLEKMEKVARCTAIDAANLFCTAHAYGYLRVDPAHELHPYRSLILEVPHHEA